MREIHKRILELMEEGEVYRTSEIFKSLPQGIVSRSSMTTVMYQLVKHSPWEEYGRVKKESTSSALGHWSFIWIRIKKEKR